MEPHDKFDIHYHEKRGVIVRAILTEIKIMVIKEQAPIEYRKVTFANAPRARRYGGIQEILNELEAEGSIQIDIVPSRRGYMKTITIPEIMRRKA
jgi:autonomous glycyl radical cofactor GrcA